MGLALLRALVRADLGIMLLELQGRLSVKVSESTVCRALKRLDLSFKKSP